MVMVLIQEYVSETRRRFFSVFYALQQTPKCLHYGEKPGWPRRSVFVLFQPVLF